MKSVIIFVLSVMVALQMGCLAQAGSASKPMANASVVKSTDFSLLNLAGTPVRLSDYQNKKNVLLVFWATWCPSCRDEIPYLKAYYNDLPSKNWEIIAVNVGGRDRVEDVQSFVLQRELPYLVVYDEAQDVSRAYHIVGIPTNIIIDKKGMVRYRDYRLPEPNDFKRL